VNSAPDISLPCFEGPLDLLLSLVRKNEVDITDLPISDLTRQYLAYLHEAAQMDLELGSEFIYMAAWLIQIKTRCLLAGDRDAMAGEDPRQQLVRELLDHGRVRQAVEVLKQKLEISEATWSRSADEGFADAAPEPETPLPDGAFNLLQILRLAQQALSTARTHDLVTPADSVSIEEMTRWLEQRMETVACSFEAQALLGEQPDAPHRIALFLAMLEMANATQIDLEQEYSFGPIRILDKKPVVSCGTAVPSR
jgi:segregation and condensation protein A